MSNTRIGTRDELAVTFIRPGLHMQSAVHDSLTTPHELSWLATILSFAFRSDHCTNPTLTCIAQCCKRCICHPMFDVPWSSGGGMGSTVIMLSEVGVVHGWQMCIVIQSDLPLQRRLCQSHAISMDEQRRRSNIFVARRTCYVLLMVVHRWMLRIFKKLAEQESLP